MTTLLPPRIERLVSRLAVIATVGITVALVVRGLAVRSSLPHFQLLAQAMLQGRLDLDSNVYDAVVYAGRYYLPFGPFPGVLFIPLVAIFGTAIPTTFLALVIAIATLPALWLTWAHIGINGETQRVWLTLLVVFGTPYLTAIVSNNSYYFAHVVVVACLAWALVLALRSRAPLAAGLLVGLAALTRASALVAVLPIAWLYLRQGQRPRRALAELTASLGICVLVLLAYNWLRFDSPLESGYGLQHLTFEPFVEARNAGVFTIAHLPKNLYYFLAAPPLLIGGENTAVLSFPWFVPSPWGMGIIWTSLWLLAGLRARGRVALTFALGAAVVLLPSLFYYGIGYYQFGYRYALDALPFMAGLAAIGVSQAKWSKFLLPALVFGAAINFWGADWLIHHYE